MNGGRTGYNHELEMIQQKLQHVASKLQHLAQKASNRLALCARPLEKVFLDKLYGIGPSLIAHRGRGIENFKVNAYLH